MFTSMSTWNGQDHMVKLAAGSVTLHGNLCVPPNAEGIVLFVHGSGSSRHSPRNQYVAQVLNSAGLGTFLFDLLSQPEEIIDARTMKLRFDIPLLSERVVEVTKWLSHNPETARLKVGYFGASTGAAAALVAASQMPGVIKAVVSRGGRPDLAGAALRHVIAPTLLIVGQRDPLVIDLNEQSMTLMPASTEKVIEIVPRATHLFEEPGTLEQVADLASDWFKAHLAQRALC